MVFLRRLVPLLVVSAPLAAVLAAGRARAGEPLSLAWAAPAGCPSRDDVLAETRRLLGGKIEGGAPLSARAEIVLVAPSDYRLRLGLDRTPGERPREVHAPTCAELGDAAALILALSIDPSAVAGASPGGALHADPAAPPPPPAPEPLAVPPPPRDLAAALGGTAGAASDIARAPGGLAGSGPGVLSGDGTGSFGGVAPGGGAGGDAAGQTGALGPGGPGGLGPGGPLVSSPDLAPRIPVPHFLQPVFSIPAPPAPPPPAPPRALRLHASIGTEAGALRDLAPMGRAGLSYSPAPLRFEASGLVAWGGDIAVASAPEKGAEFWLAAGALSACYEARPDGGRRPIAVAACGGLEAGAILGTSHGVSSPASGASPWVAPVLGGLFRWPFARPVALRLDLQLAIPLVHPAFRIEGLGVVHTPGELAVRASAGIEVDLPSR